MKLVVLGLSLSSSWGNGHATTFRALLKAYAARGHDILFLERDVPWYARQRDLSDPGWCRLAFYADLAALDHWRNEIAQANAVIVGSYGESKDYVFINLKVIQPTTNVVLATHDYALPINDDVRVMLRAKRY